MRRIRSLPILGLLLCLAAVSCATRDPIVGREVGGLDRKLSRFAFMEDGRIVTLIVDTRAALDRDGQSYMPLEIAVANRGLRQLTLTRESFTLLDEEGNRYPVASPRELIQGYEMLDFDRNLLELEGIVFNKFGAMARYPSNFSPTRSPGRLVRDRIALPKHGYLLDLIYFPEPQTGIRGQTFELFLKSPELEDPVFVRFEVR